MRRVELNHNYKPILPRDRSGQVLRSGRLNRWFGRYTLQTRQLDKEKTLPDPISTYMNDLGPDNDDNDAAWLVVPLHRITATILCGDVDKRHNYISINVSKSVSETSLTRASLEAKTGVPSQRVSNQPESK